MRRSTIIQSPEVLASFKKDLIARGARDIIVKSKGSDSKRGTKPYFIIYWSER